MYICTRKGSSGKPVTLSYREHGSSKDTAELSLPRVFPSVFLGEQRMTLGRQLRPDGQAQVCLVTGGVMSFKAFLVVVLKSTNHFG